MASWYEEPKHRPSHKRGIAGAVVIGAAAVAIAALTTSHSSAKQAFARRSLTPGTTFPHVTVADVCSRGWASRHRHVTYGERRIVFADYNIPYDQHRRYELDHLLALELGGDNSTRNLWPQPLAQAKVKDDQYEDRLHSQVCAGQRTLQSAWHIIRAHYVRP